MLTRTTFVSFAILIPFAGLPLAQEQPLAKLRIGDAAPAWTNLDGVDGKKHSLADLKDKDLVVVVFTCNDCKVANGYEQRLVRFANEHRTAESKVAVVAVSLYNHGERDSLDAMKARARDKGYTFSYIIDPTMKLGRDFGATRTPHIFVLDKSRKLAYVGPMDDAFDPRKVKTHYLKDAIDSLSSGKLPARPEVEISFGCPIRYK